MAGLSSVLMITVAVAGGAMAVCVKPVPTPASSTENPCVAGPGGCGTYISCPGPDVCTAAGWLCGFTGCAVQGTINKPCKIVTAGIFNPATGCCDLGIVGANSGTWAAVPVMVGTGDCGWCEELPPSED